MGIVFFAVLAGNDEWTEIADFAADEKETHNTGKKDSRDVKDRHNLNEFNVMSTEWGICLSSTRIDEKSNESLKCRKPWGILIYGDVLLQQMH
ncbi:transposase family protein [Parablautia muri]|uniref:Uncharacterized protein n=1 Tax=Parablautia muri TaxID=2320879 RepID=A0A9X5GUN0_9FIRM|nr:transposase family protein [Parablautia muri]NBJ95201.1 hypothetical protein [Parablautia muri]